MKLASYLTISRHGIFYLRRTLNGKEIRVSLRTRDPEVAKLAAYRFGFGLIEMDKISKWSVKTPSGAEISTSGDSAEEHQRAMEALALVMQASAVTAPVPQNAPTQIPTTSPGLKQVINEYLLARQGDVSPRTLTSFRSILGRLVDAFGESKQIHTISTQDLDHLFNKMKVDKLSKATIKNAGSAWKGFFVWAGKRYNFSTQIDVPVITAKAASTLSAGKKVRKPWTKSDLEKWFSAENLAAQRRHDLLWMPILGLFTGARLEAIGRLKLDDFREFAKGRWCVRFDPQFDKCGRDRETPLHPILIEIGLLDYLEEIKSFGIGDGYAFPALVEIDSRRTHYVSKRFGDLRKALGIQAGADFHAFRSTLISCLAKNGCPGYPRRAFVGHEADDPTDVHETAYTKVSFSIEELADAVLPNLDFRAALGFEWPGWRYAKGTARAQIKRIMDEQVKGLMRGVGGLDKR